MWCVRLEEMQQIAHSSGFKLGLLLYIYALLNVHKMSWLIICSVSNTVQIQIHSYKLMELRVDKDALFTISSTNKNTIIHNVCLNAPSQTQCRIQVNIKVFCSVR